MGYIKSGIFWIACYCLAGVAMGKPLATYPLALIVIGLVIGLLSWALSALWRLGVSAIKGAR